MLNKAMKRILNLHMATITLLAGVLMASAADKPRTLKSVAKSLAQIQGPVRGARKLSAAALALFWNGIWFKTAGLALMVANILMQRTRPAEFGEPEVEPVAIPVQADVQQEG